jgi:3-methyladenine DNA glycosylase Mpg
MPTANIPAGARLHIEASRDKPLRLQARQQDLHLTSTDDPFDTADGADNSGLIRGCHPLHAGRSMVIRQNVEVVEASANLAAEVAVDSFPRASKKKEKK